MACSQCIAAHPRSRTTSRTPFFGVLTSLLIQFRILFEIEDYTPKLADLYLLVSKEQGVGRIQCFVSIILSLKRHSENNGLPPPILQKRPTLCTQILSPPFSFEVLCLLINRGFISLHQYHKVPVTIIKMTKKVPVGIDKKRDARNIARTKKQGQRATLRATAPLAVEAVRVDPCPAVVRSPLCAAILSLTLID